MGSSVIRNVGAPLGSVDGNSDRTKGEIEGRSDGNIVGSSKLGENPFL